MWEQLKDMASDKPLKKADRRKSSPIITTRVDPSVIKEKYKIREPEAVPSRGLEQSFGEEDVVERREPVRKRKSGPTETRRMTEEEKIKYSRPLTDPSIDEFLKEKPVDWATFLEEQKELDKEYKAERKEMKKHPEGISEEKTKDLEEDME